MSVKNIERWQWVLIALVLGFLIGTIRNLYALEALDSFPSTMNQQQFEASLLPLPMGSKPVPCLTNIHVIPIKKYGELNYIVVAKRFPYNSPAAALMVRNGKIQRIPSAFDARNQYKPGRVSKAPLADTRGTFEKLAEAIHLKEPDSSGTVLDYLRQMKTEQAKLGYDLSFSYEWWKQPRASVVFWVLASVVIIGGIWPVIVSMLAFGTMLPPAKPKAPKEAKVKWIAPPPSRPTEVKKTGPTAADMEQLEALEAHLEENLQGFGSDSAPASAPAGVPTEAPLRKLSADGTEKSKLPAQEQENKTFDAKADDFYPVERHARPKE